MSSRRAIDSATWPAPGMSGWRRSHEAAEGVGGDDERSEVLVGEEAVEVGVGGSVSGHGG